MVKFDVKQIDFRPFDGDGRTKCVPSSGVLPGTKPIELTRAQARMLIIDLLRDGYTHHSGAGGTLWVLLTWCQRHKQGYNLNATPGFGYRLQLVTDNPAKTESFSQVDPIDTDDLSHSAYEEAMAFGLTRELFVKYFNKVRDHGKG